MSDENTIDQAVAYAMGTLSLAERGAAELRMAADPAFAAEVAAWEERLAPLAGALAPVDPDEALLARLEARLDARAAAGASIQVVRADAGKWVRVGPGVEKKRLAKDAARGRETFLLRIAPGGALPDHEHDDDEEIFLVSGDLSFGELLLGPGDFHVTRKGAHHAPAWSRAGCLALVSMAA